MGVPKRTSRTNVARRPQLDDLDLRLLAHLQDDARVTSVELARRLKLSAPGLQKRVRKLEQAGVIKGYATLVNRQAVGLDLLCFVQVLLAHHRPGSVERFPARIRKLPEVLECYYLTGEIDYLLKVVVATHDDLERFLFDKLMKVEGVDRVRTSIVLRELKASTALPL
jgi:DNA-binding Lrp family transcriptional regulator